MSVSDVTTLGNCLATYQTRNLGFTRFFLGMGPAITLHLHEGGLVHETKSGSDVYNWDVLDSFSLSVEVPKRSLKLNRSNFTIKTNSGQKFVLDNYFRATIDTFNQFVALLPQLALASLLERYQQQLNRGQPAVFGPLTITLKGIRYKDRELAWTDLSEVRTKISGCYSISSYNQIKGKEQEFWWGTKIPNYSVFEKLITLYAPGAKFIKVT